MHGIAHHPRFFLTAVFTFCQSADPHNSLLPALDTPHHLPAFGTSLAEGGNACCQQVFRNGFLPICMTQVRHSRKPAAGMISGVIEQSPAALKYPARNDSSRTGHRCQRITTT